MYASFIAEFAKDDNIANSAQELLVILRDWPLSSRMRINNAMLGNVDDMGQHIDRLQCGTKPALPSWLTRPSTAGTCRNCDDLDPDNFSCVCNTAAQVVA